MNQQIRFFGAIAARPAVLPLLSGFEAATGYQVVAKWALNATVKKEIDMLDAHAARELTEFLVSPDIDDLLAAKGIERVPARV